MPTSEKFSNAIDSFNIFTQLSSEEAQHHREISFDICYNYFRRNRATLTDDMEKSCCVLWSYLGSWGMLRGSSFLLQKNPSYLINLVKYIGSDECKDIFNIDVDNYGDVGVVDKIIKVYKNIYDMLGGDTTKPSSTLITKVMLGVFGCIPAYDTYFCETFYRLMPDKDFRYKKVNEVSLVAIYEFYQSLHEVIDQLAVNCKIVAPFNTNSQNGHYSKAKIIDMYGFNIALSEAMKEKERAENLKAEKKKSGNIPLLSIESNNKK